MGILGSVLAALVGLMLGLLGAGGSILTVPILIYVLGFEVKTGIAMSLVIVGATSAVGALGHWHAGNVRWRAAFLFGLAAMAGAFAGARVAALLSGAAQLTVLAIVMLAAAVAMYRGGMGRRDALDNGSGRSIPLLLAIALAVGALTGVVGVGGGFLIVPALVLLARTPMQQAVGTSLVVITINSVSAFAGYMGWVAIPWGVTAAFAGIAILGILAGTALVRFVSQAQLRRAFAAFLVGVGLFTLYQNRGIFGLS